MGRLAPGLAALPLEPRAVHALGSRGAEGGGDLRGRQEEGQGVQSLAHVGLDAREGRGAGVQARGGLGFLLLGGEEEVVLGLEGFAQAEELLVG